MPFKVSFCIDVLCFWCQHGRVRRTLLLCGFLAVPQVLVWLVSPLPPSPHLWLYLRLPRCSFQLTCLCFFIVSPSLLSFGLLS